MMTGRAVGVDRKANVLRGYVVAQLGPFKSSGRGEFDRAALEEIARLGNAHGPGMKSRFSHPTECSDGLGKYLGRSRAFAMSTAIDARTGNAVDAVRADLHFDATALDTPPQGGKPLGVYVMDLAESDAGAISSSLVIRVKKEYRINPDGTPVVDATGEELPPLWRPLKLSATDIVDVGDAVDDLLSADLPNSYLWEGASILDGLFDGLSRAEIEARLNGFTAQYLDLRFGAAEVPAALSGSSGLRKRRQRIREIQSLPT